MTQTEPAVDRDAVIAMLTSQVTRSDDPPSDDLELALGQLVDIVLTGEEPSRPVDWANLIAQSVNERHNDG